MKLKQLTMEEFAKAIGVAPSTVSRAYSKPEKVSQEMRNYIFEKATELNFDYTLCRKSTKTYHIGVILEAKNLFFANILLGIIDQASRSNISVTTRLYVSRNMTSRTAMFEEQQKLLQELVHLQVDGIILCPASDTPPNILSAVINAKIPLVFADENVLGVKYDSVTLDNKQAGYDGLGYLVDQALDQGILPENIFIIISDLGIGRDRKIGCEMLVKHRELEGQVHWLESDFSLQKSFSLIMENIPTHNEAKPATPIAIFSTDDTSTRGAILALMWKNYIIGQDVLLATIDEIDIENVGFPIPKITSFAQPAEKIGSLAVTILKERIENPQTEIKRLTTNVIRVPGTSCGEKDDQ